MNKKLQSAFRELHNRAYTLHSDVWLDHKLKMAFQDALEEAEEETKKALVDEFQLGYDAGYKACKLGY